MNVQNDWCTFTVVPTVVSLLFTKFMSQISLQTPGKYLELNPTLSQGFKFFMSLLETHKLMLENQRNKHHHKAPFLKMSLQ